MAQDFERTLKQDITLVGSPTVLRAAANSDDAIIGIRCANTSGAAVNMYLFMLKMEVKHILLLKMHLSLHGGSLELIDGGSKVVLQTGDSVEAYASAASSIDIITSVVDTISA